MQLAAYLPSEPPANLLAHVFPWVEQEQAALHARARDNPLANDMALKQFLQLLIWLRTVLLQDAAVLFVQDPSCPIFRYSVFQTAAFRDFAAASQQALTDAEEKARLSFERLPDHLVKSLQGILTNSRLEQQQDRENCLRQLSAMDARLDAILETVVSTKSCKQRGRTGETFFKFVLFLFLTRSMQPCHPSYLLCHLPQHQCCHCHCRQPHRCKHKPLQLFPPSPSTFQAPPCHL
jgi:hypothetical protein